MANIYWQGHVQLNILLNMLIFRINKFYIQTIRCNYSNCFVNKCINKMGNTFLLVFVIGVHFI